MAENIKVLLMGGTGAIGTYLVPELLNLGYKVFVTSREENISNEKNLVYITGNAKDDIFLDELLEMKFDVIIDFMIYSTSEFKNRCEHVLKNTKHYLFLSSYRVYGDNKGNPITESSPRLLDSVEDPIYLETDEYGLTKARQENTLLAANRSNWTILRPAITYSKERFQLGTMEANEFLDRALKGKAIIFPKQMLKKKATMSWAGDVAKLISRLVLNNDAMGETFTVSTAENHTWEEIKDYYAKILNIKIKLIELSTYENIIGRPYQIKYDRMLDRVIDNSKVLKVTGIKQSELMPLWDGLKIELTSFSANPKFKTINSKFNKEVDKITYSRIDSIISKIKKTPRRIIKAYRDKTLIKK